MSDSSHSQETVERTPPPSFDALNRRDFSDADYWGPDTVYNLGAIGIYRGREEILGYFREMMDAMPDLVIEVERTIEDGPITVVQWNASGTFKGKPWQGFEATGKRLTLRGCDVMEWDGDKMVSNTAYSDSAEVARQMGLMPPQGSGAERMMQRAFNAFTRLRRRFT